MRKARLRNPTQAHIKDRALSLKKNYGITIETYEKMFMSQKEVCAVCEKPETSHKGYLCVDHNHNTGQVRSLLCHNCNRALGSVGENVKILYKLIKYLRTYDKKAKELFGDFAYLNPESESEE